MAGRVFLFFGREPQCIVSRCTERAASANRRRVRRCRARSRRWDCALCRSAATRRRTRRCISTAANASPRCWTSCVKNGTRRRSPTCCARAIAASYAPRPAAPRRGLAAPDAASRRRSRRWTSATRSTLLSPTSCCTTFSATSYAAALPCRSGRGTQTAFSSSRRGRICRSTRRRTSPSPSRISGSAATRPSAA